MNTVRIAKLLESFIETPLTEAQLGQISTYIDLLRRWNARVNLTAIRDPEEIVTRHFGESLFAAQHLFPGGAVRSQYGSGVADDRPLTTDDPAVPRLLDIGSGAGFPGLPIKIWSPQTTVTLIESRQKKVAFLREVIRALTLTNIDVFAGRAEDFPPASAQIVTLRAVERFGQVLPVAAARLAPGGTLALLIGATQVNPAREALPTFTWLGPAPIPSSSARILLLGRSPIFY